MKLDMHPTVGKLCKFVPDLTGVSWRLYRKNSDGLWEISHDRKEKCIKGDEVVLLLEKDPKYFDKHINHSTRSAAEKTASECFIVLFDDGFTGLIHKGYLKPLQ